jgi:hypothetical protein
MPPKVDLENKKIQIILFFIFSILILAVFLPHIIANFITLSKTVFLKCDNAGKSHTVVIENSQFNPQQVIAKRCDELVVLNKEDELHQIALGEHSKHLYYPGFLEKVLKESEENRVILKIDGKYLIHDHLNESIRGYITIFGN